MGAAHAVIGAGATVIGAIVVALSLLVRNPKKSEAHIRLEEARERDAQLHAELKRKLEATKQRERNAAEEPGESEESTDQELEDLREKELAAAAAAAEESMEQTEEKCLKETTGMDNTSFYNVAIVGNSGAGKKTLINCLRGLPPNHPDAAPVGTGVQQTRDSARYPVPQIPFYVLWDVPGVEVDEHPAATYCHDQCLDLFDQVVLCFSGRWTELCSSVASFAHEKGRSLVLVYTRFENDVANEVLATTGRPLRRATSKDFQNAEARLRERVTSEVHGYLDRLDIPRDFAQRLLFVESYSILYDGPTNASYDGLELVDQLVRCMVLRHPDNLSADELSMRFRTGIVSEVRDLS